MTQDHFILDVTSRIIGKVFFIRIPYTQFVSADPKN
jgi:hypothetical protein